jgi:F-type H+-transporting ATPase subunit delta
MAASRAASRYVKSLLDLAVEKNALDAVHRDMVDFAKVCEENRAFTLMLRNPIFKGKVNPLTMAILNILTEKNREPLLPQIAKEFHLAYNVYKGVGQASVTTAVPLDAAMRAEFEKIAKGLSEHDNVELREAVDPEMIGGFVLNVGDRQVDASLKNKLKALRVKFSQNEYIKEY